MQELLPLDGHVFREEHGQIAWGKTLMHILKPIVGVQIDWIRITGGSSPL